MPRSLRASPLMGMMAYRLVFMLMRFGNRQHISGGAARLLTVALRLLHPNTLSGSKADGCMKCTVRPFGPTSAVPFPRGGSKKAEMALNRAPSTFGLQSVPGGVLGFITVGTN